VYWESCIVVNGNYTQAVLIVDNQTGAPQTIGATVNLWQAGNLRSTVYCYSSTLNTGLTRACFGPTFKAACGVAVQGDNTLYLDWNTVRALSRTELMCSS